MKKFAKMLALGLALAMTFGMSVSANNSPQTKDPVYNFGGWENSSTEIWATTPDLEVGNIASDVYTDVINDAWDTVRFGKEVVQSWSFDMEPTKGWDGAPVTVYFTGLPSLSEGQGFILFHYNEDGTYDTGIEVVWDANAKAYKAVISSFSPFVLVRVEDDGTNKPATDPINFGGVSTTLPFNAATGTAPVSPKTGETLPVAGMMAVLCLAGALVCVKKARCNG